MVSKNTKTVCQTDVLRFTGYYTNCKVCQNSHLLSTPRNCLGTWIRYLGQKFPLAVSNETSNHQASPLMLKEDFKPLYLLLSGGQTATAVLWQLNMSHLAIVIQPLVLQFTTQRPEPQERPVSTSYSQSTKSDNLAAFLKSPWVLSSRSPEAF